MIEPKLILEGNKRINDYISKFHSQHTTSSDRPDKMIYHESWDALMPVWDVFNREAILSGEMNLNSNREASFQYDSMKYALTRANITSAFFHLSNLISQYNEQRQINLKQKK